LLLAFSGFFLGLIFGSEDGGDVTLKPQAVSKLHGVTTYKTAAGTSN
jgi:hypothetical protein